MWYHIKTRGDRRGEPSKYNDKREVPSRYNEQGRRAGERAGGDPGQGGIGARAPEPSCRVTERASERVSEQASERSSKRPREEATGITPEAKRKMADEEESATKAPPIKKKFTHIQAADLKAESYYIRREGI